MKLGHTDTLIKNFPRMINIVQIYFAKIDIFQNLLIFLLKFYTKRFILILL